MFQPLPRQLPPFSQSLNYNEAMMYVLKQFKSIFFSTVLCLLFNLKADALENEDFQRQNVEYSYETELQYVDIPTATLLKKRKAYSENENPKKYNLSVCALFKNEAPYLKEWITYHQIIGVDHFYLYNNESFDQYLKILAPFVNEGTVTLIDWNDITTNEDGDNAFLWALGTQAPAYENAIHFLARDETKWLVFIDVSDFLVPHFVNKVTDLLDKFDDYPGIVLHSECFDAMQSNFIPKQLIIEALTLTPPPYENPHKKITKTIFKPDLCNAFYWPPYRCAFQDGVKPVRLPKSTLRINHYINRGWEPKNIFLTRKKKLQADSKGLSSEEIAELVQNGYEVQDPENSIGRFVPKVLRKLGYDSRGY
jgi:hypothetical protein